MFGIRRPCLLDGNETAVCPGHKTVRCWLFKGQTVIMTVTKRSDKGELPARATLVPSALFKGLSASLLHLATLAACICAVCLSVCEHPEAAVSQTYWERRWIDTSWDRGLWQAHGRGSVSNKTLFFFETGVLLGEYLIFSKETASLGTWKRLHHVSLFCSV